MSDKLSVENLCASWGGTPVLRDITMSVKVGEFACLSGPNGSGKSTLMTILAGMIPCGLSLNSPPPISARPKERARRVAFMLQCEIPSWSHSVREVVLMGRYCHTNSSGIYSKRDFMIADEMIARLRIQSLAGKSVLELSGGEFQKVRIARCLAQESRFILLDEPVANLDFSYQNEILSFAKEIAKERNIGVLATIHDLNIATRYADTLTLLPKLSACLTGRPSEILTPENLQTTYGAEFKVFAHPVYGCPQAAATI